MFSSIHHIGKVVSSIEDQYSYYTKMGYRIARGYSKPKKDTAQDVLVGVLEIDGMFLELLEPLSSKSPIASIQKKGGGLHHVCYKVENLESAMSEIVENKLARQITPVTISVWNNKRVVFFITKEHDIFELIEDE